jgi:hypothetical protein
MSVRQITVPNCWSGLNVFFFCVLDGGGDPSPCNGSCD